MDNNKIIGNNLKSARIAKKITQKDIAKLLNIKQQAYSRYETGKIELNYYLIIHLCYIYSITPNELFDGTKI